MEKLAGPAVSAIVVLWLWTSKLLEFISFVYHVNCDDDEFQFQRNACQFNWKIFTHWSQSHCTHVISQKNLPTHGSKTVSNIQNDICGFNCNTNRAGLALVSDLCENLTSKIMTPRLILMRILLSFHISSFLGNWELTLPFI